MRICLLGDAGTENTASYMQGLAQQGADVHCISLHRPIPALMTPSVTYLPVAGKWQYLARLPQIRSLIKKMAPDAVIGYRLSSYGLLAAHTGVRPLVVTATGFDILWGGGADRLRRAITAHVLRRADLVITWDHHMTVALPFQPPPDKVLTIPRGVDLGVFHPGQIPTGRRAPSIVASRSLQRWYRVDLLLQALQEVARKIPEVKLEIVGDGPDRRALQTLAHRLDLESRVTFHGHLNSGRLANILRGSKIYVAQIAFDGVSASLLEAMGTGVFPVVPDNDANRGWIKHGQTGLLYPPGDVGALANNLVTALRNTGLCTRAAEQNLNQVQERGDRARNMRTIYDRMVSLLGTD